MFQEGRDEMGRLKQDDEECAEQSYEAVTPRASSYRQNLQSINQDNANLLTKSLSEAGRGERSNLLLRVTDRDRYYYGVDDIFRLQSGLYSVKPRIWRSHKTKDGMRPVIYYLEHLVRDTDETKTFSRALISFVKYNNPKTIMHPILVFVLEILWTHLAPWQEQVTQEHVEAQDNP
eukprot:s610_g1.t1